ncbi:glycosyltransferase family 90 protein [Cercospora zeae-maydis SCOH1-5]|uniref:Glycosyltransferase family 90 protein n=1 Tax=Cercospora zeae-maydis SCOH1-5 TaxID=717836 RepID=A0A6A6FVY9_9PEZI|nr:glycosyltransferase family 90 protein [Cercospora zeae-maydis SCOH1-5]
MHRMIGQTGGGEQGDFIFLVPAVEEVVVGLAAYHWARWRAARHGHAIDALIRQAEARWERMLLRASSSVEESVAAYSRRRHRPPPPGFAHWFDLAHAADALIIEDFFDPIYTDLRVFDSVPAADLRAAAESMAHTESAIVRGLVLDNGTVTCNCQAGNFPCWDVRDMMLAVASHLPDTAAAVPVPINGNASPRIVLPHASHGNNASGAEPVEYVSEQLFVVRDWPTFWPWACPSTAPLWTHPELQRWGLAADTDAWRDVCQQPWLSTRHGALVRPLAQIVGPTLLPLFAPARIAGVETAIRYPDAIYWAQDPDYHNGSRATAAWSSKQNKALWRGSNSGGSHDGENWHHFHRHRFVALTNATYQQSVVAREADDWAGFLQIPSTGLDVIRMTADHFDTGFSLLTCRDDLYRRANAPCAYTDPHFHPASWVPLHEMLSSYRYLFDIDGNSFSGRFHALLLSESVVFKATIYEEWHDARLIPWLHFVPLANRLGDDIWTAMDYFLAREERGAAMARAARAWSLKVLRPEDMELYLLRLLLEWTRLLEG